MTLTDRLAALMKREGHRPADAARHSGVSYAAFYDIVKGKTKKPAGETLQKIADAYGVTVEWLLSDNGTVRETRPAYDSDAVAAEALVINPNLARRLVGEVKPEHRRTRLAIIHEIEEAFVEAGQDIPQWLEELRREVLGR